MPDYIEKRTSMQPKDTGNPPEWVKKYLITEILSKVYQNKCKCGKTLSKYPTAILFDDNGAELYATQCRGCLSRTARRIE